MAERAGRALTSSVARLSGPSETGAAVVDDVLRQIESPAQCLLGRDVELTMKLAAGGAAVGLGPCDIDRIVLNLLTNARKAVCDGGKVALQTRVFRRGGGRHVWLACSDTGPGVSPHSLTQLLREGASSKRSGTGLGLAIVRRLVRDAGGSVEAIAEPTCGATFAVTLPVVDRADPTLPS